MITGLWWIQTILSVAEIIEAYLFARGISQEKVTGYRKWILLIGMGSFAGLTIYQRTFLMYSRLWLMHSIVTCIIVVMLCYRKEKFLLCVTYAMYFETLYCMDLFIYIGIAVTFLNENFLDSLWQIGSERIVVYSISRGVMAILLILFYKNKGKVLYYLKSSGFLWVFVLMGEHLSLLVCDEVFIVGAEENAVNGWKLLLLLYPLMILLLMFYLLQQKYRMMYEQIRVQNALYYKQYEEMEKKSREKARVYHDFKNHLILLQKLVLDGDTVKVQAYLDGLLESEKEETEQRTGHSVLDYLIQAKIAEAQQRNITVEEAYECNLRQIDEEKLRDCGVLLGNLWDNAIAGCEQAEEERQIFFSVKQTGNAVAVKMENSCGQGVHPERLRTTKANKEMHGIGLQNVEYVVAKYGGTIERSCRNGVFLTQIIMIL